MNPHRNPWRLMGMFIALVVLMGVIVLGRTLFNRYYYAPAKLQSAYARLVEGKAEQAELEAWEAFQLNPELTDAALLAAQTANQAGRFEQANLYASRLTSVDGDVRLKAYRLLAQIAHHRTFQLSQAETYYRLILGLFPDDIEAQTGLANLLGLCGRRTEAIPLVLNLIRLGAPSDLLVLLAREDTVVNNPTLIQKALEANPDDPLPLMAQAWHLANDGQHQPAIELLRRVQKLNPELESAQQLIFKYLAASGQFELLRLEIRSQMSAREKLEAWADYWLACAQLIEGDKSLPLQEPRQAAAIRCYAEAALRAPDSKMAIARLATLLHQHGSTELAKTFEMYSQDLQALRDAQEQMLFATTPASNPRIETLLDAYVKVGRVWEALGWSRLAGGFSSRRAELEKLTASQPMSLVPPVFSPCRQLNLAEYPLPDWTSDLLMPRPDALTGRTALSTSQAIVFRDDAAQSGFQFRYCNGVKGQPARRMFEFPGGGIAVLDFDQDGRPDLALAQGTPWPPGSQSMDQRDVLMHNLNGQSFQPIPAHALGLQLPDGFGQGLATGDVNSDGFPDLYIAEIGQNHLLINNGDGTFHETTMQANIRDRQWTTSCLVADITGDGLADLYDVNYVQGSDVFDRVCTDHTGQPAMCMPGDFDAATQVLWINQGDGTFVDGAHRLAPRPAGKGLGCLAFAVAGQAGLSLLIANDTTPNFLYRPALDESRQLLWTDCGVVSGIAFSAAGKAQGCMGIAADDINADRQIDFVVTNFLNESCTFYSGQSDGTYRDETTAVSLTEPTRGVLGFGTQFIDADNDGTSELFMANGHIDDLRRRNVPYQMPPQLFQYTGDRFRLISAQVLGDYFQKQWIGRSAVRLDWNGDGRLDLAVGHLEAPYALLTNTTPTHGNWLALRLVGTRSNRDAIGTQVTVTFNQTEKTSQLTAGDGYMASNQRQLHFGLGSATQAERVEIIWPSGQTQVLEHVVAGAELLVVEPAGL